MAHAKDHYEEYIKANPEWEYLGLYYNEGISATSTKHREGFQEMVQDPQAGDID